MADTNTSANTEKKVITLENLATFLGLMKEDYVTQTEAKSMIDTEVKRAVEEDLDYATEDDIRHLFDDTTASTESEESGA